MHRNRTLGKIVSGSGLLWGLIALSGCGGELAVLVPSDTDDPQASGQTADPEQLEEQTVLIRFVNNTVEEAVDVQFYATNDQLEMLPDGLFDQEGYLVTTDVGVAGSGLIEPGKSDAISFPCTDSLSIGTLGGAFLDNDSGEQRGQGEARWLQEGGLSLCGATVTFVFSGDGETFDTSVTFE